MPGDQHREGMKLLTVDLAIAPSVPLVKKPCFQLQQLPDHLEAGVNRM